MGVGLDFYRARVRARDSSPSDSVDPDASAGPVAEKQFVGVGLDFYRARVRARVVRAGPAEWAK